MRIIVPAVVALMALAVEPGLADRAQETAQALAWAGPVPVPLMAVGPCQKPPVLDGKFEPGEWDDACAISTLSHHGGAYAFPSALVYFTYDAQRVYFGYLRYKQAPEWFTAKSRFRDSATYLDPHIELFLSPDPGTGKELVYQFCINAYGAVYDILNVPAYGQTSPGYNPRIEFKTSETPATFCLEGAIDVKDLDPAGRFRDGAAWKANFCWAWPQIAWASRGGFWIVRDNMGDLRLDASAPAVQWLDATALNEGKLDLGVAVKNVSAKPLVCKLAAAVTGESEKDVLSRAEQEVSLAPGQRRQIRLAGEGGFAGKRAHVLVTCTGGGGQLYYWQLVRLDGKNAGAKARSDEALKKDLPMPKDIVLTTRYAPLLGALEVQCDVWSLRRAGLDLEKVRLRVEAPGRPGQAALAQEVSHFQKDLAIAKFDLPADLPFGRYVAHAEAVGKDGHAIASAQSEFTRLDLKDPAVNKPYRARDGHILDWIGSRCGVVEAVPPPWTPVAAEAGGSVSVLGRRIVLDGSGLPREITSVGEPLLAGPVKYVATIGGKAVEFQAAGPAGAPAIGPAGLEASWAGKAAGAGLTLTTRGAIEFDGLIRYRLDIDAPAPVRLDALYLDVPVRREIAERLNLPNSHILLPPGQGVLWKSKDAVDNELMNTLVSHVWVGNWKCGLAFAADDTKGWYETMGQSLEAVERADDAVHLKVFLVQGPAEVSSTSLAFALMASPTRQRATGWRAYPAEGRRRYFWIMDWFDDRAYEGPAAHPVWNWDDVSREQLDKLRAQDRTDNPVLGLPYTNPWFAYPWVVPWTMDNGSPVLPIMNEEWANMPSRWGAVRPVASYRDYMAFNYDFYFRTKHYGGFYIDEAYGAEKEDINMLNGSGWLDRAGNLRGSYHAMDVRELFKRQYALSLKYSPARKPFMLNHTSWGMSPQYMSFVTCGVYVENLPIGPGQSYLDHLPLSNLQFWSGRAWGHFGDVTGIGPDAKANRYCVGALMLHDVCCSSDPKNRIKAEFGIAESDVTFYGYWEQPRVVSSSHDAVKASVYRRPAACLMVALNTDTRTDQEARLIVDAEALKLPRDFIVLDAETKQSVAMDGGSIRVRLAPRDVRYLYLAPQGWQVPAVPGSQGLTTSKAKQRSLPS